MEVWATLMASAPWISWTAWGYIITAAVGGSVGFVELIARYRDAPMAAVKCLSAMAYILVNAGASVLALYLLRIFGGESLFAEAGSAKQWVSEILVAGLGAMTFMRSSIFNISIGANQQVPVGPSVLLEVILNTADRGVDRKRAGERGQLHQINHGRCRLRQGREHSAAVLLFDHAKRGRKGASTNPGAP